MTKQPARRKRTQEKAQKADITSETPCSYSQEYHKNTKLEAYIYAKEMYDKIKRIYINQNIKLDLKTTKWKLKN